MSHFDEHLLVRFALLAKEVSAMDRRELRAMARELSRELGWDTSPEHAYELRWMSVTMGDIIDRFILRTNHFDRRLLERVERAKAIG